MTHETPADTPHSYTAIYGTSQTTNTSLAIAAATHTLLDDGADATIDIHDVTVHGGGDQQLGIEFLFSTDAPLERFTSAEQTATAAVTTPE